MSNTIDHNKCLKCAAAVTGGRLWRIDGQSGFLCKACEKITNAEILRHYDEGFAKFGIPSTKALLDQAKRGHFPEHVAHCASSDGPAWVVRCAPMRPGPCWTAAILPDESIARTFAAFYSHYIYTEVRVLRVEAGKPREGPAIDDWERSYSMKRRTVPPPIKRRWTPPAPPLRGRPH